MAETQTAYGLTAAAAKLLKEMTDKFRQQLPSSDRRTRRAGPKQ